MGIQMPPIKKTLWNFELLAASINIWVNTIGVFTVGV